MTHQLPERPNLEQLRKQAKSLLNAGRANDPAALDRFRALPSPPPNLALHDAQFVIAREYGFKSWNELRQHVEEISLTFEAAVDEFLRCATGDAPDRAFRLLARHPGIAQANPLTKLVLGDSSALQGAPLQPGGPQNWEPLLYVCHSCLHRESPHRAAALVSIARALLRQGANPNAEYHWNWHRELPRTVLWGALVAMHHLPLAEVLLEHGANPTDGVSAHIAAGTADLPALDLLHRFGLNANGIPGGVPPLRYILNWAGPNRIDGVRWLLEHGADPNLPWSEPGDAPLHVAAQRWDVPMVELLVSHGANIHQPRADGRTPHTIAALYGNREVAQWLLDHGAIEALTSLERFVSACASGDRQRADELLLQAPTLPSQLQKEHHLLLQVAAERGDALALDTMLACGFDPNVRNSEGVTALHTAAMAGQPDAVRSLLSGRAEVNALDGMFSATPLVWASEGRSYAPQQASGHVAVARLLLAAGSSRDWVVPEKAPNPERTQELLIELIRAADAT